MRRLSGIDLSGKQVEVAQETIDAFEIRNVETRHTSILDMDRKWGPFDYIICHDVGWKPRFRTRFSNRLRNNPSAHPSGAVQQQARPRHLALTPWPRIGRVVPTCHVVSVSEVS
jgi:hypothetical protein